MTVLIPAKDALEPKCAEVGQSECHDEDADGETYAAIAEGEVDCAVECSVAYEDEDDCAEGCREEGHKAGGYSHQQAGEPAEVAEWDAEEVSSAKSSGRSVGGRGSLRHAIRITVYG